MHPIVRPLAVLALFLSPIALGAQSNRNDDSDADWLERCKSGGRHDDDRGRACEVRNVPVKLSGRSIAIDGRQNGGIRVTGWNGDSVRVTARIQAQDRNDAGATALLSQVRIEADGRTVRADGPSRDGDERNWSVSYVVFVPRRFDLNLEARNGGLGVTGVSGTIELETTNGSVALVDVGGAVRAQTQNGSLNVQLTGSKWDGSGLDAETRNGSVRIAVPSGYSAQLETGTVNGSIRTEIPVTVTGQISRRLSFPIGRGGAPIKAMTTNGSVTITQR